MRPAGEVLFFLLVLINVMTIMRLGSPMSYRDRGVSWYLWLTAWSAVLFDGSFLVAVAARVGGLIVESLLILALALRVVLSAWLLWMVASRKDRDGTNKAA